MANQPTKRVEFYGIDAGRLGLVQDAAGQVVAVDARGYEIIAVEVQNAGSIPLGTWQGQVYGSAFPGGGFSLGFGSIDASDMGQANNPISTDFLVLHNTAVQAGAVYNVAFMLSCKSE